MKYLNKYNNISSYNSAKQGEFELPHVSLINDTKEIKYDPVQSPGPANNEIWYTGEYYDLEDVIEKASAQGLSYVGPSIVSNELVGNKYVITFNGSVTKLGPETNTNAFYPFFINIDELQIQCNITSITLPNSVTYIGEGTFQYCNSLMSITIPNSITSIEYGAFYDCPGLTSISVESSNTHYDSRNNCNAIIETTSNTLIAGCKNTIIPNNVTSIGDYAFTGCSSLTSITIPNSVTSIGESAFDVCTGLISITIPNSVTSIGGWAFQGCSKLTSITISDIVTSIGSSTFQGCSSLTSINIPNSITSIGESAFYGCSSLTSITIPNSVMSIENEAFYGCYGLTSITCNAVTPPELGYDTFSDTNDCPIYVPAQSVDTYKAAQDWSEYATRIQAIS